MPPQWRNAASKAGGVAPLPDYGLNVFPGWHSCADPGNKAYNTLCQELLDIRPEPVLPNWCGDGYAMLKQMGQEKRGDVVECALAAADCAKAAEDHLADPRQHPRWVRFYSDVVGGGCGQGDRVTAWIQERLHRMFRH